MPAEAYSREQVLQAIRDVAKRLDRPPSRSEFMRETGISEYHVLRHFDTWNEAVAGSGLPPHTANLRMEDDALLEDWGAMVRRYRRLPTRAQYRRYGRYSPGAFEKHFGPWSSIPAHFRRLAEGEPAWADVLTLLPPVLISAAEPSGSTDAVGEMRTPRLLNQRHSRLDDRPVYGNPLDFRGLRHQPVNEQGVVFLFGMVAHELGYLVEAVQSGFPDCEAKRQIGPDKWQRVRIEFEFESRNFLDHGHHTSGCDVIVCWHHNWQDCPAELEVVELSTLIETLANSEEDF